MAQKEPIDWITVNGKHIPIYEGESKQDAYNRAVAKDNEDKKKSDIARSKKEADKASGKIDTSKSTVEDFDINSLGELKDADNLKDFIKLNLSNPKFKKFGQDNSMGAVQQLWYEMRRQREIKHLHEIPIEEAIQTVRDNIQQSHISGWFRNGDSGYKPRIAEQMFGNSGVWNAALNMAYHNYKDAIETDNIKHHTENKPLPFNRWLTSSQKVWRGTSGQKLIDDDVFTSFTTDERVAENFAHGKGSAAGSTHGGEPKIESRIIRPIDTWGNLQTNGEFEFLIPISIKDKSK